MSESDNKMVETMSEIEAELRELSKSANYSAVANYSGRQPTVRGEPIALYFGNLADRIKAARTAEKSSAVGNAAAMRKALERLDALNLSVLKYPLDGDSSEIYDAYKKPITLPMWGVAELLNGAKEAQNMARAALSAPPRNCDVGTAEEQTMRYNSFCNAHRTYEKCCEGRPADGRGDCELIWAQMPYTEGGAE